MVGMESFIPVITIDGPSASGKGTIAQCVAKALDFHYLDSGALYRLVALQALRDGVDVANVDALVKIAGNLNVDFQGEQIFLDNALVTGKIRAEECGIMASKLAVYPQLRESLIKRQRDFCREPGLVTDGRDMGSVVFPGALLKVFLTASVDVRAQRRYNQLIEKGMSANITDLQRDIQLRDERDANRGIAPLQQNKDARLLDTTSLSILQAQNKVLKWYEECCANKWV